MGEFNQYTEEGNVMEGPEKNLTGPINKQKQNKVEEALNCHPHCRIKLINSQILTVGTVVITKFEMDTLTHTHMQAHTYAQMGEGNIFS